LIHGTFAFGATWVTDEQPDTLRRRLKELLREDRVRFNDDFNWGKSGGMVRRFYDQSNTARLKGAKSLEVYLKEVNGKLEHNEQHFLITHSHGGNVAMYALRNAGLRKDVHGMICMATPFLYPRKRRLPVIPLWAAAFSYYFLFFRSDAVFRLMSNMRLGWIWSMIIATPLFSLVALYCLVTLWITAVRLHARFTKDAKIDSQVEEFKFDDVKMPILLVRSCGDEASGLLRSGQFFSWLSGKMLSDSHRRAVWLIMLIILMGIINWSASGEIKPPGVEEAQRYFEGIINSVTHWLIVLLLAIAGPFFMFIAFARLYIGWDAFPLMGELEMMTEDSPPGHNAEMVTLLPIVTTKDANEVKRSWIDFLLDFLKYVTGLAEPQTLAHSEVYARAQTADAIADWCHKNDPATQ
jgi:hypothetical protein